MFTSIFQLESDCRVRRARAPKGMILGLLLAVSSASTLSAANLLSNGEFSNFTVSPWVASQGHAYLASVDHANNASSGSARISDDNGTTLFVTGFYSECVTIQAGAPADVSGYFMAASSVPGGSWIKIGRFFYADTACTGSTYIKTTGEKSATLSVPGSWTLISNALTAPTGAQSVKVLIEVNSGSASNLDVYADGLALNSTSSTGPTPIFVDNFEDGSLRGWSSTAQ